MRESNALRYRLAWVAMLGVALISPGWADTLTPPVSPPSHWVEAPAFRSGQSEAVLQAAMPDRRWWLAFQDPHLAEYLQMATTHSPTLQASLARIEQAKAEVRQAFGDQLPSLNGQLQGGQINLPSPLLKSSRSGNGASSGGGATPFSVRRLNFLTLLGSVAYEADIWGKYHNMTQSARKALQASEAETRAAEVMLQAEVANAYFDLLRAEALYTATLRVVSTLKETHALSESLYQHGLETTDTLFRQERDIAAQAADLNDYQQAMSIAAHALSVLTGQTPQTAQALPHARLEEVTIPIDLQTGIPLAMILQRPDVIAQERRVQQSDLNVRVARKEFLPTVKVADFFGMTSVWAGSSIHGSSFLNLLAGSVRQPIFQGGKIVANLRLEQARQREQAENYRQTILTALQEVEDSLSTLLKAYEDQEKHRQEVNASTHTLQLTQAMYQSGLQTRLAVLQSENELQLRELKIIQDQADQLSATVSLYKALGGGY